MIQVTGRRPKPIADIANRLALRKLAEEHRNQMRPTVVTFRMLVRLLFSNDPTEANPIQFRDDLGK